MLNDKQQEAALQIEGPVLILAGAGSGKTRVLTNRTAYMIDEMRINPWNIMAITFTNKAAGEMRERINDIVGYGAESIWVTTFHSTCVRILRRYIDRLGYDTNFTIYDTDDQKTVMKDICKRLQIDTKQMPERRLLGMISHAKDELISPEEYELDTMGDYNKKKAAAVYKEYQSVMRKNNAVDFDDLIVKTVELFRNCPDVLDYYQERFLYIMVDEYQDTNTAQFELIRLLASKHRNLCVVGDDDQSIYKFRGANIRNILDFEQVYPDAKVIKLEQNYRSTQTVLDAANAVIHNNRGRKDKALWTDRGEGERLHFKQFENAYEEAEYITGDIKHKSRDGEVQYRDCAVLYRTNAQARILEEKFVLAGIPYDVVGGTNFYARREIKDLLAYLKTIDNGRDDIAVRRIINVPKRGIGATTLTRVQDYALEHDLSFYDALRQADQITSIGKSYVKLQPFVSMIQVFRAKLPHITLEELITDIIETTKYVETLEASDEEDAEARIENIDELISKIVTYEANTDEPTLGGFLEEVALVADIDRVSESDNKVLLMTLHSAKGLEFSHVYLAGMEDGVFPGYMTITSDDAAEMEEERRLCYVGITRAKDDLTLTCAKQRMIRGETQYNAVSRFVREIPAELMDQKAPVIKRRSDDIPDPFSFPQAQKTFSKKPYASSPAERNAYAKPFIARISSSASGAGYGGAGGTGSAAGFGSARGTGSANGFGSAISAQNFGNAGGTLDYAVGDTVSHIKFGKGVVKNIVSGGRDYEVTVEFDTAGVKKMFANFAKLKKV